MSLASHPIFAESDGATYGIHNGNQTFKIPYKITNGNIEKISYQYPDTMLINLTKNSANQETLFQITIPRELTNDLPLSANLMVLLNNEQVEFIKEINKSPCFRTLSITIPSTNSSIKSELLEIIASNVSQMPSTEKTPTIYVAIDKNYKSDNKLMVSGCTSLALEGDKVTVDILDSENKVYKTVYSIPASDGSFTTFVALDNDTVGTYSVKASYAGQSTTNYFTIPEFPQVLIALVIALSIGIIFQIKKYDAFN